MGCTPDLRETDLCAVTGRQAVQMLLQRGETL